MAHFTKRDQYHWCDDTILYQAVDKRYRLRYDALYVTRMPLQRLMDPEGNRPAWTTTFGHLTSGALASAPRNSLELLEPLADLFKVRTSYLLGRAGADNRQPSDAVHD